MKKDLLNWHLEFYKLEKKMQSGRKEKNKQSSHSAVERISFSVNFFPENFSNS